MLCIDNALLFDGELFRKNKKIYILDNKIIDISNKNKKNVTKNIDAAGNIVCPGFIDIQVNGGGGVFLNENHSLADIKKVSLTHAQFGTTSLLPTFITDHKNKISKFIAAINHAMAEKVPGIIGIHFEGPFINQEKKGIHSAVYIRSPEKSDFDEFAKMKQGVKLVTLAPELIAADNMAKFKQNNFIIFAGHSQASFAQMNQGFKQGIQGITHLFNACSQLGSREPGIIGAFLLNDTSWAGIIADGYHVSFATIKIALKVKDSSKFILVSDAMSPVGTNEKSFKIYDQEIFVEADKYQDASGTLAGSALTVHKGFQNILKHKLVSLEESLKMTSTNVAKCLGIDQENTFYAKGRILPQYDADVVILDKNNFNILKVIQQGKLIK